MNPTATGVNPYAPPKAQVTDVAAEGAAQPIWNPNAAASWSLLFSPAFGSFLQMLNWRALGESRKADHARGWFIVSLAMLAVYVLVGALAADAQAAAHRHRRVRRLLPHRGADRRRHRPGARLKPIVDPERCEAKTECVRVCPYHVFELRALTAADKAGMSWRGRLKARFHGNQQAFVARPEDCHACAKCVAACPEDAIKLV